MKVIVTDWVKDTREELSEALLQKDHSIAGDMENELHDSHRVGAYTGKLCIKLLQYKVCLVYAIVAHMV